MTIGVIEEYRQYWVPGRSAEFLDAIANIIGVTAGLGLPLAIALLIRHSRLFVSKVLGIYMLVLIPLLLGLLYINEREFLIVEGPIREKIKNLAAFIGRQS